MIPSLAQCPNCGVVHKVREVGVSDVLRKEDLGSVLSVEELKGNLPEKMQAALTGYDLEYHQLREIQWILENQAWGRSVVLVKDMSEQIVTGKYIQIISDSLWRFGNFTREDQDAEK